MAQEEAIELFGEKQIRVVWDDVEERYYFSVVDVVHVLTESVDSTAYWRKLERNESVNCATLKGVSNKLYRIIVAWGIQRTGSING